MGLREYSRYRGVTLGAVQKAISSGRITKTPEGKIDPAAADRDWARNTDPTQQRETNGREGPAKRARKNIPPPDDHPEEATEAGGSMAAGGAAGTAPPLAASKAIEAYYKARDAKVLHEERVGRLVNADQVRIEAFNRARLLRDTILNVPARISALLAAEADPAQVERMLVEELRRALTEAATTGQVASG